MRLPYEERFWSRVRKTNRCWLWTAGRGANGYGFFRPSPTSGARLAHRIAYELLLGPIPEGMRLHHICQNRQCVKPAHLRLLTQSESASESSRRAKRWSSPLVCRNGHVRTPENTSSTAAVRPCVASANTLRNGATTSGRSVLVLLLRRLFLRKALATAGTCRSGFPEIRHGSAPDREHHQIAV